MKFHDGYEGELLNFSDLQQEVLYLMLIICMKLQQQGFNKDSFVKVAEKSWETMIHNERKDLDIFIDEMYSKERILKI